MPSKEELREHIKAGFKYAAQDKIPAVDHLTDHLWGVVGMWLSSQPLSGKLDSIISDFYENDVYDTYPEAVTFLESIRDKLKEK